MSISIHAPLAGCDSCGLTQKQIGEHFNPRTPCGVRPGAWTSWVMPSRFQSTHPLRGATRWQAAQRMGVSISIHAPLAGCDSSTACPKLRRKISIHAPLAGCDRALFESQRGDRYFNPRTPCGVRRFNSICFSSDHHISIHAPLAGCDGETVQYSNSLLYISIHAPLAGCDGGLRPAAPLERRYFNPRTPCGVRRSPFTSAISWLYFNPRTPCGVRHQMALAMAKGRVISIHAPLAGCDATPSRPASAT